MGDTDENTINLDDAALFKLADQSARRRYNQALTCVPLGGGPNPEHVKGNENPYFYIYYLYI